MSPFSRVPWFGGFYREAKKEHRSTCWVSDLKKDPGFGQLEGASGAFDRGPVSLGEMCGIRPLLEGPKPPPLFTNWGVE